MIDDFELITSFFDAYDLFGNSVNANKEIAKYISQEVKSDGNVENRLADDKISSSAQPRSSSQERVKENEEIIVAFNYKSLGVDKIGKSASGFVDTEFFFSRTFSSHSGSSLSEKSFKEISFFCSSFVLPRLFIV